MSYKLFAVIGLSLATAACALPGLGAGAVGAGVGAAGGAAVGSQVGSGAGQVAAIAAGAAAGALGGHEIAERLSEEDLRQATDAEQRAVETGQPVNWASPYSDISGMIEPGQPFESAAGQVCREFSHIVYIEGRAETIKGTACRQPDGTWNLLRQGGAE